MLAKATIVCLLLCSLMCVKPESTSADPLQILTPQEYISLFAREYGANEKQLMTVAKCESGFKPTALGDHLKARNIYQYHLETFQRFSLLIGEKLDYDSYYDQAKLTAFIFAKYPQLRSHWTCFKIHYTQTTKPALGGFV